MRTKLIIGLSFLSIALLLIVAQTTNVFAKDETKGGTSEIEEGGTVVSPNNIYGAAWSSNIGWISFNNCTTPSSCSGSTYGVNMNPTTGELTGYAWSSNIGWITFNSTTCPVGTCGHARIDLSKPDKNGAFNFRGWARACSVYASGCSGTLAANNYRGNWDGYIALSSVDGGAPTPWNFKLAPTGIITGYAWGSDIVGWINSYNLRLIITPTVTLTANPTLISYGDSSVLTWTSTNTTSCTGTNYDTSGLKSGTKTVSPPVSTSYTVTCTGVIGGTVSASAFVEVEAQCTPPAVFNEESQQCETPEDPIENPSCILPQVLNKDGQCITPPPDSPTCIPPRVLDEETGVCVKTKIKPIYKEN